MLTALLLSVTFSAGPVKPGPVKPGPVAVAPPARVNILWIIGEDVGPEFGCYGHPHAHTPRVDALAAEGVRFERAFTVTPVCSTSRSALMTGHYPWSFGAHNHRSHRDGGNPLTGDVRLLTHRLREAGYYTANIRRFGAGSALRGTGKTDWNFTVEGDAFDGDRWQDLAANQPFYAQVNFPETHRGAAWKKAQQTAEPKVSADEVTPPAAYPDHPRVRQSWAEYLNAVNRLDAKVGAVLDRLEADGLAETTVVVFLGDHGRAMPRGKQWPYDSGLRIPMVVRLPEAMKRPTRYAAGGTHAGLVESIDLTAQTLQWAGMPVPTGLHGRPFWGDAVTPRQYAHGGRDRGDETVDRIRTLRDERYRYIRNYMPQRPYSQRNRYKENQYPVVRLMQQMKADGSLPADSYFAAERKPREELYDLSADPDEVHNLADDPAHRERLLRMRRDLEAWLRHVGDEGRFPEDPDVIEAAEEQMRANYAGPK